MKKIALLTGITGQDGSYLVELLLEKDYEVHGLIRRSSTFPTERIDHLYGNPNLKLHYGDLSDGNNLRALMDTVRPDEVYNLGAQSHVRVSFDMPVYTADIVALGSLRLLEALRGYRDASKKEVRIYQASSSEMFGSAPAPQNENTPFHPRSPYGVAKVYAYWQTINHREAWGLHASNGILFNHESPRRGETFVTRKITRAATRIKLGLQTQLSLGNLDARRDWGFAGDYVEGMWRMLQQEKPGDYVLATGKTWSIRQFLDETFTLLGLDWTAYVKEDPRYHRPAEVDLLQGDPSKAEKELGWKTKVDFKALVEMMVQSDLKIAKKEKVLKDAGH